MNFSEAIVNVIAGKRITRLEWADRGTYGVERDGFLMLRIKNEWHRWIVNDGDLHATDWIVMD